MLTPLPGVPELGAVRRRAGTMLLGAALAASAEPLRAQAPAPAPPAQPVTLQGIAWDSLSARPLAGAVVQIALEPNPGNARTAVADSLGRWQIDGVPPGAYLAGYFHRTLDELGLAAPTFRLLVQGGATAELHLGIPSPARLRAVLCGPAAADDSTGALIGVLRDAEGDSSVAGATVSISWRELVIERGSIRNELRRVPVTARGTGTFVACRVPADTPVELDASAPGLASGVIQVQAPAGQVMRRDLALGDSVFATSALRPGPGATAAPPARGTAQLRGTVLGPDGRPRPGAVASVAGTGREATTGAAGTFLLDSLPSGTHGLDVRAVGFAPVRLAVDLARLRPATVTARLSERVNALATVTVLGKRSRTTRFMEEFAERKRRASGGTFLGPVDLERRNAVQVTDIFRTTPGIRVYPGRGFGNVIRGRGNCTPTVFLDGLPLFEGADEIDQIVSPSQIMAVEVYQALGTAPAQYSSANANGCGVVALWTRR